jgi:8-oxo-dGTP pyrophosphatase MutT (NUDIX family)
MMTHKETLERLRAALRGPLPGHDGFLRQAGYKRADIEASLRNDPAPRESAVLVLLFPRDEELHTLLMLRPSYEGVHSGQVSFPGGKREEGDADAWATALREFREETGIALEDHEPLGQLSRVYIPPSRMLVTPCVAYAATVGPASPDPNEVDALFDAPLTFLLADDAIRYREQYIHIAGRSTTVPYFELGGHVVWGATAMMLWELRELLR